MSAPNFRIMRDFPLFAKEFYVEAKQCPACGAIQDAQNERCEFCDTNEELEDCCYFDDVECEDVCDIIRSELDDLNSEYMFHKITLESGYYSGVQLYVEVEHDLHGYDYDNDECHYYFDCCRSVAYRKYQSEINKINRKLSNLAKRYGFDELVCTGWFSNGETRFSIATPRTRLYSENRYTDADDILEANASAIDMIDAVIENLRSQMESPVERLSVAVEVKGGLVQAAYANGDISVDVYDLDVSDFPDVGEQEAADLRELDLKKLVSNPEWHTVY